MQVTDAETARRAQNRLVALLRRYPLISYSERLGKNRGLRVPESSGQSKGHINPAPANVVGRLLAVSLGCARMSMSVRSSAAKQETTADSEYNSAKKALAGAEGFEPSALGFGDRCSDQTELRPYTPTEFYPTPSS